MIAPALLAGLLLTQAPAATQTPPATPPVEAPKPPDLPTELALQVENVTLRQALLEAQVRDTVRALQQQRDAIDAAVRTALPGYVGIDWQTGQPKKAAPATDAAQKDGGDGQ